MIMALQHLDDRESHSGIISPSPGRGRRVSLLKAFYRFIWRTKEALSKGSSQGEAL